MNPDEAINRMADILLPAPPPASSPLLLLLSALGIVILSASAYVWMKQQRTTQPASGLSALQQFELVQQQQLGCRETAYRLATVLRLGFDLPQLTMTPPAATINSQQWQQTISELNRLRYAPAASHTIPDRLLADIKQLLVKAPQD